jgi:hypothetical protein
MLMAPFNAGSATANSSGRFGAGGPSPGVRASGTTGSGGDFTTLSGGEEDASTTAASHMMDARRGVLGGACRELNARYGVCHVNFRDQRYNAHPLPASHPTHPAAGAQR